MANVFSRDCCARSKGTLIQGQIEHLINLVVVMIASLFRMRNACQLANRSERAGRHTHRFSGSAPEII
jgi:hypothetical protein